VASSEKVLLFVKLEASLNEKEPKIASGSVLALAGLDGADFSSFLLFAFRSSGLFSVDLPGVLRGSLV
jgi:hypothetical protein